MPTASAATGAAAVAPLRSGRLGRVPWWRRPGPPVQLLMGGGGAFVATSGWIHLHLWMVGYRDLPTIGPMFLGQAVAAFVLGPAVAVLRRWPAAVVGALFLVATAGGFVLSDNVGLFGFHDHLAAPYAGLSLVVEGCGAAVLAFATAATLVGWRARP